MRRKQKALVHQVRITKIDQVAQFQIRLPRTAERIIGIETGLAIVQLPGSGGAGGKKPSPWSFRRSKIICEVTLQSSDKANVFFHRYIRNDNTIMYGDFTVDWTGVNNYTHKLPSLEEPVSLSGAATTINGILKNGVKSGTGYEEGDVEMDYTATIYLWYELKEENGNSIN